MVKPNPKCQMVCHTEPSEKQSSETVWKRAGTFKKYLAGDTINNVCVYLYIYI